MTSLVPGIADFVCVALAVASLSVSGCRPGGCALSCGNNDAYVRVPNSTPDQIERVETEPPCIAQSARENDSEGEVYVRRDNAGTCQVRVYLTNGDTYAFSVEFASHEFYCCGTVLDPIDASIPVLIHAGADGGAQAAVGDGGTSVGSACSPVNAGVGPCGGDVVGAWTVTQSCLKLTGYADMTGFGIGCASAPVTWSLQVSGTWTAYSGGMYSDNTTTSGDEEIELPASCLTLSGATTTCQRMGEILRAFGYAVVNCTFAASGGCTCSAAILQTGGAGLLSADPSSGGRYATSGNVVTTEDGTQYPYCVSGNTMTWTPQSTSPTTTGTIVFQKQ